MHALSSKFLVCWSDTRYPVYLPFFGCFFHKVRECLSFIHGRLSKTNISFNPFCYDFNNGVCELIIEYHWIQRHRIGPFNANCCCCCFLHGLLLIFSLCFYFVGRPMIECSECLTWIHLSCAKIRKSNVPDVFICQKCRDAKHTMRRSNRVRTQPKTKAINLKP